MSVEGSRRAAILEMLEASPGSSASQLAEHLALHVSTIRQHLRLLTRRGLVVTRPQGRRILLFPAAFRGPMHAAQPGLRTLDLLGVLAARAPCSAVELIRITGWSRRVVYYHLAVLRNHGLIETETMGRYDLVRPIRAMGGPSG